MRRYGHRHKHEPKIPRLSTFQKDRDIDVYTVNGKTYEYPVIGQSKPGEWYVWFKGGLDIVTPSDYGLEPRNKITINKNEYTIHSVIFIRTSKKGIITLI
jgi:hypothetical protein